MFHTNNTVANQEMNFDDIVGMIKTGTISGVELIERCIYDKRYLLACLIEVKTLDATFADATIFQELISHDYFEQFKKKIIDEALDNDDNLFSAILALKDSGAAKFFLKEKLSASESTPVVDHVPIHINNINHFKLHLSLNEYHTLAELAEILIHNNQWDHLLAFAEDDTDILYQEIQNKIIEVYFKHTALLPQFFASLRHQYEPETNLIGPFDQLTIQTKVDMFLSEAEQDANIAYALAIYHSSLLFGLINTDEDVGETLLIVTQNYLDLLMLASNKGQQDAKSELFSNAMNLFAIAQNHIQKMAVNNVTTFADFTLACSVLMAIKPHAPYAFPLGNLAGYNKIYIYNDNQVYMNALRMLGNLMLEHLPKLPGGSAITKAEKIRAALPFFYELKMMGNQEGAVVFQKLTAELNALENPGKKLTFFSDLSTSEDDKRNERHYFLRGSSNKAYGITLVNALEKSVSQTSVTSVTSRKLR